MRRKPTKTIELESIVRRLPARGGSWWWEAFHFDHLMVTSVEPWGVGAGIGFRVVCNGRGV